jgi:hypothetical protein
MDTEKDSIRFYNLGRNWQGHLWSTSDRKSRTTPTVP